MSSTYHEDEGFVPPKANPILAITIASIFVGSLGVGSAFASSSSDFVRAWLGAKSFAAVTGEVTKASTTSEANNTRADITFTYEVDGELYEGDNRLTARSYRDAEFARRDSQDYKVGKPIEVFYHPKTPALSVITRDVPLAPALMRVGFSLAFFVVCVLSVVGWRRSRTRTRAAAYARYVSSKRRAERRRDGESS